MVQKGVHNRISKAIGESQLVADLLAYNGPIPRHISYLGDILL